MLRQAALFLLALVCISNADIGQFFDNRPLELIQPMSDVQPALPVKEMTAIGVPLETPDTYRLSYKDYGQSWAQYKVDHKKFYKSTAEEQKRFALFVDNVKMIEAHNLEFLNNKTSYWMGTNQFTDWTYEEYLGLFSKADKPTKIDPNNCTDYHPEKKDVPESVDYSKKGWVTPARNQGGCGSCWAFAAVESTEGQWAKKTGNLLVLSPQQLVDCATNSSGDGHGCWGGSFEEAFGYIKRFGLEMDKDYPYDANNQTCTYDKTKAKVKVQGCKMVVPYKDEEALKIAVGNIGPISISIDAHTLGFRSYKGGIYDDVHCGERPDGHAVLMAGYGKENGKDFWLIKNSWGTDYGINGYIKVRRNAGNRCGVSNEASFPIV